MKATQHSNGTHNQSDDPREITKWARRYATYHAVPMLVSFTFAVVLCTGTSVSGYLAVRSFRAGQMVSGWTWTVIFAAILAAVIWYIIRGSKLVLSFSRRFRLKEGSATLDTSMTKKQARLYRAVISLFSVCIAAHVLLVLFGHLPLKYMQPVSAIYCVPFVAFLSVADRREGGPLLLLWPILYGLHAILIVAGVPLPLSQASFGLSIWIPAAVYGMTTGLVFHVYSRFALRKLKKLAKVPPEDGSHGGENIE